MDRPTPLSTATLRVPNLISRSPLRRGFLLISVALACFALSPIAQAVTPAPDGGYPNGNTAEGDNALLSLTTGYNNTAIGFDALLSNTTGSLNTANGFDALLSNTTGSFNTANGFDALVSNTTGDNNTATGFRALGSNTTGSFNTANGFDALVSNTTGDNNTANGEAALFSNTTGSDNTANGLFALFSNTTGNNNTANGFEALNSNTNGVSNTATGFQALGRNSTGSFNTANGDLTLQRNTIGSGNTANGDSALQQNTTGGGNTANGDSALLSNTTGSNNTANGSFALGSNTTGGTNTANGFEALGSNTTGSANTALGFDAGRNLTTGNSNIDIGNAGVAGESNTIRIGTVGTQTATFIAGISGATVTGTGVVVNSSGQLGVASSSVRFKEAIKPMDKASEAILALRPVTFRYKHELDPDDIPQFGLVAEQVEKVNPDLVARDAKGEVYTVRYEAVNAMLLNEFLKEHCKVEEQEATITQLKSTVTQQQKGMEILTARLEAQASQIRKVCAQLEASRPLQQMVLNDQ